MNESRTSLPIYFVIYEQDRSYPYGVNFDLRRLIEVVACDLADVAWPNPSALGRELNDKVGAMQAQGRAVYPMFVLREPENPFQLEAQVTKEMRAREAAGFFESDAVRFGRAQMHTCDWCCEETVPPDTLKRVSVVHTHMGGGEDITHEHEMALCDSCRSRTSLMKFAHMTDDRTPEQREADQAYVDYLETRVAEDANG